MKRIAVISFVSLLLFTNIGYYVIFCGDLIEVRREAAVIIWGHQNLGDKMVYLSFPMIDGKPVASGLTFTDDDEFTYQGRMYDVAGSNIQNGYIVFKCYTDNKETALSQELSDKIDADNGAPTQSNRNTSLFKALIKDYTFQNHYTFCVIPVLTASYMIAGTNELQPLIYRSIASPPPESFVS